MQLIQFNFRVFIVLLFITFFFGSKILTKNNNENENNLKEITKLK